MVGAAITQRCEERVLRVEGVEELPLALLPTSAATFDGARREAFVSGATRVVPHTRRRLVAACVEHTALTLGILIVKIGAPLHVAVLDIESLPAGADREPEDADYE
jgi:hypothetical protein